ncbi:MAG TPA: hypothetical protein EYO61_00835 [Campylobacterales bacterium]|nr:hypothetical protein [Campylobacterales bacterium]HIO70958.1 hypothetical protein [Campylobacterales bacterium]
MWGIAILLFLFFGCGESETEISNTKPKTRHAEPSPDDTDYIIVMPERPPIIQIDGEELNSSDEDENISITPIPQPPKLIF